MKTISIKKHRILACLAAAVATPVAAVLLEEVVVTANMVEQFLQEVPLAVSAISGDELVNSGVAAASDLSANVPNLQVSSPYSN
ncbi:hypothetical protein [Halioxenophilus aromaticivorans]|uniref:hypothetical protein n=1 Tax=Halioxenophilus aromaticivorans TaxID=1306992 RepID=UPI0031E92227